MDAVGRGRRRPVAALVLGVIALVAVVRLPSFVHQLYDPDEAAIAAQAISIRDGGTLYVDAIDRKPPLPPFLYAASFRVTGSTDLRPLHALAAIGLAGAALVLALGVRRRHGGAAGWWAAALAIAGAVAFFPVDAQAANYAHLALLPGAAAMVLARRGRTWTALLGGVALGVAVLCRQTWLIGIVPGAIGAALASARAHPTRRGAAPPPGVGGMATGSATGVVGPGRAVGARHPWVDALAFVLGTAVVIAAVGLVVPFGEFWRWTFSSNSGFVTAGVDVGPTLGRFAATVGTFVAFHLSLVALVLVAGRRRLGDRAAWRDDLDLWLWLATALVAVVAGFRFFGHYWLQALPPAVLLAAPLAARLALPLRRWVVAGVAVPTAVAVAFAWTPGTFRTLPDPQPLARYVRAHTRPGQPVWIWGSFPEVYWAADRPPGGALVHSDFVTGLSGGRRAGPGTLGDATPGAEARLLRELRAHPPALVLDSSTADLRRYGAYPLRLFPALDRYVRTGYREVARIGGVRVLAPR